MKKLYTLALSAFLGMSAFAQTQPERIIVHEKYGDFKGFLAERVDSVTFPKLEGRVAADVNIKSVAVDSLVMSVTRTPNCRAFKLLVIPEVTAKRLPKGGPLANFIDKSTPDFYYQDFENGVLKGAEIEPNTKYVLATVGFDQYGIACSEVSVPFTTPKKPLVGDVKITTVIDEILPREFTCSFYPSEDVEGFAVVTDEAGTMQSQYEQWGPMMGFKNFGDLVKGWGIKGAKDEIGYTWKDMNPNTDYDLFVQAWDVNGTYADCDTIKIRTKMLGGEGVAAVDVKLGSYKMAEWGDQGMLPSQEITYTPNDQASCYRFSVVTAEEYAKDSIGWQNDVRQEPPFPGLSDWFFYETLTTDYQINPNTEFVVLAAAKNGVGTWGDVKVNRFKTPAKVEGGEKVAPAVAQTKIAKRAIKSHTIYVNPSSMFNIYKKATAPSKVTLK